MERRRVAATVRKRIEAGGERLWRLDDFSDIEEASATAVAQALSRLVRAGVVERLSKGVYYRSRGTAFGRSRANPADVERLAGRRQRFFPSGVAAANLLGFTSQNPARKELATTAPSLPRKLVGQETLVHTRRPEAWSFLSEIEAALLDFLRLGGRTSELPREETLRKTLELLSARGRYERLARVGKTEPPRVRALLGALGELLGKPPRTLSLLRESLNPLSTFDFGEFSRIRSARKWQAKMRIG